jgi:hypothetical protein
MSLMLQNISVKKMQEFAKKYTASEIRRALVEVKKSNPGLYAYIDVDQQMKVWVEVYGFKDNPEVNEFGEVCP